MLRWPGHTRNLSRFLRLKESPPQGAGKKMWRQNMWDSMADTMSRSAKAKKPLLLRAGGQADKRRPPATSNDETNMILGRALNMTTSSVLRCTILDANGRVQVVNGDFKRSELLSKYGLLARDLRKIDVSTHNIVPTLLVRENSILVVLLHIRALIMYDRVILFDIYANDEGKTQSLFLYDLEHKLRSKSSGLPYEQRALEAILISVMGCLEGELRVQSLVVSSLLTELEKDIDRDKLRQLLTQSKQLSGFLQKVTLIRDALSELIDNDEELSELYLTEKAQGHALKDTDDHSNVELMLESYYNYCDEIVQKVASLADNIKNTEEVINIVLDTNRNTLMMLELKFQIGMMALSGGGVIAALYGMNLENYMEETWWGFGAVSAVVGLVSMVIVLYSLRHLRRLQKLQMGMKTARPLRRDISSPIK